MRPNWPNRRSRLAGKLFFLLLGVGQTVTVGQPRLQWADLPSLPNVNSKPNPGVAGAFAGMSQGVLLVAGGANFPDGYPWQGGQKVWHSAVYVLTKSKNGYGWQTTGPLGHPLGYGASAVWRDRLICVGGTDAHRRYADVFTLTWNQSAGRVQTNSLPDLPLALANCAAAVAGDTLYVFGGESERGTERSLYALNLNNPATGWQKQADLPGPARAYTALVAYPDGKASSLYVVGGRQTVRGVTTVFADAYVFKISQNRWERLPDLPTPLSAHGATVGDAQTLLAIGGDEGSRLKQIEQLSNRLAGEPDGPAKQALTAQRNALQVNHPGFSRRVWQYHTGQRTWSRLGTLPFPVAVTTPVVRWNGAVVLPSGEVSPGIRTAAVRRITVQGAN